MQKRYHGKYERTAYLGEEKMDSFVQQAGTIFEGVFSLTAVGLIMAIGIGALCKVIGG